jgi:hypothetical protein
MLSFLIVMIVAGAALAFVAWPLRAGDHATPTGPDPHLIADRDRADRDRREPRRRSRSRSAERRAGGGRRR